MKSYNTIYLTRKYGEQILKDFNDLFTRQFWNLTDIGKKYGFSRERARQIFKRLYRREYQSIKKTKQLERVEKQKSCSLFFESHFTKLISKLDEINLEAKVISQKRLAINKHIIAFGSRQPSVFGYGVEYILYKFVPGFDFAILCHNNHFYIVPAKIFSQISAEGKVSLYIRSSAYTGKANCGRPHRNISEYKEAWNLLA